MELIGRQFSDDQINVDVQNGHRLRAADVQRIGGEEALADAETRYSADPRREVICAI